MTSHICYVLTLILIPIVIHATNEFNSIVQRNPSEVTKKHCIPGDFVCISDNIAYEVFSELHNEIDDDKDGGVDPEESTGFAREELNHKDVPYRAKKFHRYDNHISKDELLLKWKQSDVYKWDIDNVIHWLVHEVLLPEYQEKFKEYQIDGPSLPKLARKDMYYLTHILKMTNSIHKQKIRLKTIDLILFGPPKHNDNLLKDVIAMTILAISVSLSCYVYQKYKENERCLKQLIGQLDSLTESENSLKEFSFKLKTIEQRAKHSLIEKEKLLEEYEEIQGSRKVAHTLSVERLQTKEKRERLSLAKAELLYIKNMLKKTEKMQGNHDPFASDHIILFLQYTYEMESQNTFKSKYFNESMANGSLVVTDTMMVDKRIEDLSTKWKKIEELSGLKLFPTPGISKIKHQIEKMVNPEYRRLYGKAKHVMKVNFPDPLPTVDEFDSYDYVGFYEPDFQTHTINRLQNHNSETSHKPRRLVRSCTVNQMTSVPINKNHCSLNGSASCSAISSLQQDESSDVSESCFTRSSELLPEESSESNVSSSNDTVSKSKKKKSIKKAISKTFSRRSKDKMTSRKDKC